MKTQFLFVVIIILFLLPQKYKLSAQNESFRIMFYNAENYFDLSYDSTRTYNHFTPNGEMHWTKNKYIKKRNSLFKTILAAGEFSRLMLIGLAEVENANVVNELIENTPLNKAAYKYLLFESDDIRGIDVALIYNTDLFLPIYSQPISVTDSSDLEFKTRDMLYVKGIVGNDTLNVFVVHWPSRYRGILQSEPLRMLSAYTLLHFVDSLCDCTPNANIMIMGDFNDNPSNKSVKMLVSKAKCNLFNLTNAPRFSNVGGSMKYQNVWYNFDQIIASKSILYGLNGLKCEENANIFDPLFLLEDDKKYNGYKPNRTYAGYKYNGGVSDHLPVFIDVWHVDDK